MSWGKDHTGNQNIFQMIHKIQMSPHKRIKDTITRIIPYNFSSSWPPSPFLSFAPLPSFPAKATHEGPCRSQECDPRIRFPKPSGDNTAYQPKNRAS